MKYLQNNRLWQLLVVLFLLHQGLEKGLALRLAVIDNYLDDLLCMPILLGGLLAEQKDLVNRNRLSWWEIALCTLLVAWLFEMLLPGLYISYTSDAWDVVCYTVGALFFGLFLQSPAYTVHK